MSGGSFYEVQRLWQKIGDEESQLAKTQLVRDYYEAHKAQPSFSLFLFAKLSLPKEEPRVYGVKDKRLLSVFGAALGLSAAQREQLQQDYLGCGDASEVLRKWWARDGGAPRRSTLTLKEVDEELEKLTQLSKQGEQAAWMEQLLPRCTPHDIKWIARLIRCDLWVKLGAKYLLNGLHADAFAAYKRSNNLKRICAKIRSNSVADDDDDEADGNNNNNDNGSSKKKGNTKKTKKGLKKKFSVGLSVGTPVKPMLARASKSFEDAEKRAPHGLWCEIKYDGERIQIHKDGDDFTCFSRNLKLIPDWKIEAVKEHIPRCTDASQIILDGEILLMSEEGKPLPFGTLAKHKKKAFTDATVCVFLFDILYHEGTTLLDSAFHERRSLLESIMTPVEGHVQLSELHKLGDKEDLKRLMKRVMNEGLEGLVIKDKLGTWNPGARHWLKMKKDYLKGGTLADSADLLVVGAFFGHGAKGGLLTTLLLACRDDTGDTSFIGAADKSLPDPKKRGLWKTVVKCGNGWDDTMVAAWQSKLKALMTPVSSALDMPSWLDCSSQHRPNYVATDPTKCPVWEVAGAEFTNSEHHTAHGYSIRFPRFVRERTDKDWTTATTLKEIISLAKSSAAVDEFIDNSVSPQRSASPKKKKKQKEASSATKAKQNTKKRAREEPSNDNNNNNGSASAAAAGRAVCKWDAAGCTRKNPDHFKRFAHPQGAASRPACRYGASCKRQNPVHWRGFRHADELAAAATSAPATSDNEDDNDTAMQVDTTAAAASSPAADAPNTGKHDYLTSGFLKGFDADEDAAAPVAGTLVDDELQPAEKKAKLKTVGSVNVASLAPSAKLENVFRDIKVVVESKREGKDDELTRYLIAYGADVQDEVQADTTHIVSVGDDEELSQKYPDVSVRHPREFWKAIQQKKLP